MVDIATNNKKLSEDVLQQSTQPHVDAARPPTDTATSEIDSTKNTKKKKTSDKKDKKRKDGIGGITHWVITHLGIDWVLNSFLSLLITFNLKGAKINIDKLNVKDFSVWESVFQPGAKAITTPFTKLVDNIKGKTRSQKDLDKTLNSNAEILLMVVAGTLVIPLMKWFTEHKDSFIGHINKRWKRLIGKEPSEEEEKMSYSKPKKESWVKWMGARLVGVILILGVNSKIEDVNNKNDADEKKTPRWALKLGWTGNLYQSAWNVADWAWRKNPKVAGKIANFFNIHKGKEGMSDAQLVANDVAPQLLVNDNRFSGEENRTKLFFAEQVRLTWKEVVLTFIIALMIAGLTKLADVIGVGKKKKGEEEQRQEEIAKGAELYHTQNKQEKSKNIGLSTEKDNAVANKNKNSTFTKNIEKEREKTVDASSELAMAGA